MIFVSAMNISVYQMQVTQRLNQQYFRIKSSPRNVIIMFVLSYVTFLAGITCMCMLRKCFNEDLGCVKEIRNEIFKTSNGIIVYTIECGRTLQHIVFQFIESSVGSLFIC